MGMKPIYWNLGKNLKLKLERGIGFEDAMRAIENGSVKKGRVKSVNHPGQPCYTFHLRRKNWYVPFTETSDFIYLHTIIEAK